MVYEGVSCGPWYALSDLTDKAITRYQQVKVTLMKSSKLARWLVRAIWKAANQNPRLFWLLAQIVLDWVMTWLTDSK